MSRNTMSEGFCPLHAGQPDTDANQRVPLPNLEILSRNAIAAGRIRVGKSFADLSACEVNQVNPNG